MSPTDKEMFEADPKLAPACWWLIKVYIARFGDVLSNLGWAAERAAKAFERFEAAIPDEMKGGDC